ncbi:DALR anticodon-binding domain-containing protein [Nocardiopsis sediminis]|uniref:DALR anticodon-binding domain-containing protein n=1 Tax=Nocardiopsis sediminis TaxID=1778267 RepID=A0ABV8FIB1_9ACTN
MGERTDGGTALEAATPWWVDALFRRAAAEVVGGGVKVPSAQPRRVPAGESGDYASALPLRLAGPAGRPAAEVAADIAAVLRDHPQVADADAEGRGFVAVTLPPEVRLSVVRAAADDPAYLTGGGPLHGEHLHLGPFGGGPLHSGPPGARPHEMRPREGRPGSGRPLPAPSAGGADGREDAASPAALSPLHLAGSVAEARDLARDDARRRIAAAAGRITRAADRLAAGGAGTTGGDTSAADAADPDLRPAGFPLRATGDASAATGGPPFPVPGDGAPAEVTWRDPYLDAPPGAGAAARLLGVIGEASARIAFCRSVPDRPKPGEATGSGLPAVPTAEEPGEWARLVAANPAFAVRYAHAHAVRSIAWAHDRATGDPESSAGPVPAVPSSARPPAEEPPSDAPSPFGRPGEETPPSSQPSPAGAGHGPARSAARVAPVAGAGAVAVRVWGEGAAAELVGELFDGPGVVLTAARRGEPHILVRYLEGLADAYHGWWESCGGVPGEDARPVAGRPAACDEGGEAVAARLALCAATAGALATGLSLLGVSAPTRL